MIWRPPVMCECKNPDDVVTIDVDDMEGESRRVPGEQASPMEGRELDNT